MYSRYIDIGSTYIEVLSSSRMSLPTTSGCSGRDHLISICGRETNAAVMRQTPHCDPWSSFPRDHRQTSHPLSLHLRCTHLQAPDSDRLSLPINIWRNESGQQFPMASITSSRSLSRRTSKPIRRYWHRVVRLQPTPPTPQWRRPRCGNLSL